MPDIVITPNRGTSNNPKIDFTGTSAGTIKLEVLSDGSIAWNGANGSLFSIADSLSGSLMSVNDISGLPAFEVFSDNRVVVGQFGAKLGIGITTPQASLHVAKVGVDEQLILGSAATNRDISMAMYSGTTKAEVLRFQSSSRLMFAGVGSSITQQSFFTSGSERLTIASSGNIGIGTTSPGEKLTVVGNAAISNGIVSNSANDADNMTGGVSMWSSPSATTSLSLFKSWNSIFGRTNTLMTNGYATYHIMDTSGRGWVWRYATGGSAGTNVASLRNDTGQMSLGTSWDWSGGYHAQLNIAAGQGSATTYRDIDMHGSWAAGEGHAITATHAGGASNIVGQIVFQHDGPGSRIKFGRLYHSGDQSGYPLELISTGANVANLILNNGNVGLGVTSPSHKLHFEAGSFIGLPPSFSYVPSSWTRGSSGIIMAGSNNADGSGWSYGGRIVEVDEGDGLNIAFDVNYVNSWTNNAMVISGRAGKLGNVGIGTTSPSYRLHVEGDSYSSTGFYVRNSAATFIGSVNNMSGISVNGTSYDTFIVSGGNQTITVKSGGNVGINQTAPSYKLDVNGEGAFVSNSSSRVLYLKQNATNAGNIIQFKNEAGGDIWELVARNNQFYIYNTALTSHAFYIVPGNNNVGIATTSPGYKLDVSGTLRSTTDAYFATSSGSVGIGNTSPSYKLHVSGDIYANGGWFRVSSSSGIYWETYGGGWYMNDSTWLRAYNDKAIITNNEIRGTIFVDANDTGYYVNPATGTNLNGTLVNNGGTAMTGGWNRNLLLSSTFPVIVFNSNSTKYSGIGVDYSSAAAGMYFWVNGSSADISGTATVALGLNTGNFVTAYGSFRAPVFYDSNDTAYYTDPASTSILSKLSVGNAPYVAALQAGALELGRTDTNYQYISGWTGTMQGGILANCADNWEFVIHDSGHRLASAFEFRGSGTNVIRLGRDIGWGVTPIETPGNLTIIGNAYAPVFYDYNDTNFRLDLASTTTSLQIAGAIEQGNNFAHPNVEWAQSGSATGMVIIKLPGNTGNYGMIHAVIDIYEYSSNSACTITVAGHNWNGAWYNISSEVIGYTDKQVRVGAKDSQYCIVIGTSGSSWSYGQVRLRKIQNGSYYNDQMDLGGTYSASITTTESFSNISGDLRNLRTPNNINVGGAIYGQVFYDSNNTSYYVDPNNNANIAGQIYVGGWFRNYGNQGLYNESYGNHWYATGNDYWNLAGNNASNIGIILRSGGHQGTIRGYVYADSSNNVGFLNNGGAWRLRVVDGDYILADGSSIRGQLFYDSNDTGYYVNPNSASNLYRLNVAGYPMRSSTTIDMSNTSLYSTSNYYPVVINLPTGMPTRLRIVNALNSNVPSWATHGSGFTFHVEWTSNGSGWGTISVNRTIHRYTEAYTNSTICGGITQMTNSSNEVIWLRGGGQYYFESDSSVTPTAYYGTYTDAGQSVTPQSSIINNVWGAASTHMSVGAIKAAQFIDVNDEGYYLDPNGTSKLNNLQVAGAITDPSTNGRISLGGNFHIDAYNGYDIYTNYYTGRRFRTFYGAQGESFRCDTDGIVYAYSQFRTPIIYDNNDSGFYVDPNSYSNFHRLSTYFAAKDQNTNWTTAFQNTPTSGMAWHGDVSSGGPTGTWWFYQSMRHSNSSNYWGTQIAYGWEDNANEIYQRNISGGNWTSWVRYLNTNNYSSILASANIQVNSLGIAIAASGTAGSISLNQSGTRSWTITPTGGNLAFASGDGLGAIKFVKINVNGDSYINFNDEEAAWGIRTRTALSTTELGGNLKNIFYNGGGLNEGIVFKGAEYLGINALEVRNSGIAWAYASFRAPIFYDSNDTGYYVDGTNGTALRYLRVNGDWGGSPFGSGSETFTVTGTYASICQRSTTGNLAYWLHHIGGDNNYYLYGGRGATNGNSWDWAYRAYTNTDGNHVQFRTSARAPIFYDSDDTNYYVDANNTGTSAIFAGNITVGNGRTDTYIYMGDTDEGSRSIHNNSNRIGFLRQDGNWGSYCDDSGYWQSEYSIRGPLFYDSNDTNYYADPASTSRLSIVSIGVGQTINGQSHYQWEGATYRNPGDHTPTLLIRADNSTTGLSGSRPALSLYNNNGADQTTIALAFVSAEAASPSQGNSVNLAGIIAKKEIAGNAGNWSNGSLTFYTKNGSIRNDGLHINSLGETGLGTTTTNGYRLYVNGSQFINGSLNLSGSILNNGSVSEDDGFGIYWDSSGSSAYGIFREGGAWNHPYPDLRIAFHTGIKLGANSGYQGIKFYNDYDMATQVMSVNNGSDGLGANNVYVNNSLQAGSSLRAPIFYDSNDTGYYLDPASTSNLNRLLIQPRNDNYYVGTVSYVNSVSDWQSLTNTTGQFTVTQMNNFAGGGFSNYPSSVYTYGSVLSWRTENHSFQLYAAHTGDLSYKTQWSNDNYSGWLYPMVYGRQNGAGGTVYGTIFYDQNSTGYYCDPASTSVLNYTQINYNQGNFECASNNNSSTSYSVAAIELRETSFGGTSGYLPPRLGFHWGGVVASQIGIESNGRIKIIDNPGTSYEAFIAAIVYGDASVRGPLFYDSNNTAYYFDGASTSVANNVQITTLGVGTAASGTGGEIRATNNITAYYSDERLKTKLGKIEDPIAKVKSLSGFYFEANETAVALGYDKKREVGVSAQEVQAVLPEIIAPAPISDKYMTVRYEKLIPLLIEAIKEQQTQIEQLSNELKSLKNKL